MVKYFIKNITKINIEKNYIKAVTARTNASKPKLEQMLYYKDTKLRRRRRGIYRR